MRAVAGGTLRIVDVEGHHRDAGLPWPWQTFSSKASSSGMETAMPFTLLAMAVSIRLFCLTGSLSPYWMSRSTPNISAASLAPLTTGMKNSTVAGGVDDEGDLRLGLLRLGCRMDRMATTPSSIDTTTNRLMILFAACFTSPFQLEDCPVDLIVDHVRHRYDFDALAPTSLSSDFLASRPQATRSPPIRRDDILYSQVTALDHGARQLLDAGVALGHVAHLLRRGSSPRSGRTPGRRGTCCG